MDGLLWTIAKLFGGVVGYGDVLWIATSSVCLLLLAAASRLNAADSGPGSKARRAPLILIGLVIGVALASGLPDWLGIPQVNDYATPWHVLVTFWLLSTVPVACGFFRTLPTGGRHPLRAGGYAVAGLLLGWVLIGATLRMGAYGVIAPAALLYAAPLPAGGVLLGWALACGRRRYALYVAAWFIAVATVGLSMYLLQMNTPMYQVAQLAGVPRFSPEYAGAVSTVRAAIQAQVLISAIYFIVALALLVLPLPRAAAAGRGRFWWVAAARRTTSEQTRAANRQVTLREDRALRDTYRTMHS
jgi:hypothetical protein